MMYLKPFFLIVLVSLQTTAQEKKCNCCTPKHQEFNFWVGSWVVTNPDGTKAGVNVISKIQENCVLQENWTGATGSDTGTSNNFYNYKTKQWEQIWVDNQGQSLHLKGGK